MLADLSESQFLAGDLNAVPKLDKSLQGTSYLRTNQVTWSNSPAL